MQNPNPTSGPRRRRWRWLAVAILVAGAVGAWFVIRGGGKPKAAGSTFAAKRGPLDITVIGGGSIQAQESQEIKCEVRVGYQGLKILKIVEEGYLVTDDDVKTNKVIVELDSSELRKQITQQDIQFESTAASYVDAQQAYDIQVNQNLSDIKAAEQKAKFARMDLDKFLGGETTQQLLDDLGLKLELTSQEMVTNVLALTLARMAGAQADAPAASPAAGAEGSAGTTPAPGPPATGATPALASSAPVARPPDAAPAVSSAPAASASAAPPPAANSTNDLLAQLAKPITFDFSRYADETRLGDGEAKQKIRKFKDDLQVSKKELGQAQTTYEGTRRLFDKKFVAKTELDRDEIAYTNSVLKVQTADTMQDLYLKYDFPKSAEETLSKFLEALRELERSKKGAVARLAQAEARLKSAQGQYNLQAKQRKEAYEQLELCTIRAKKPGLVVYGGGGEEMYWRGEEQIREGATVRERQAIITIPDMSKMSLKVKIHETYIKKIQKGQKVKITLDAFPDKPLDGEVSKVGVLPDSQNRWMNPDMKVYLTTITVNGTRDWLKPGMSAKAEILVNRLDDVVYIPIQAVTPIDGKQFCFVVNGGGSEQRELEIGEFNDEFIEVKKGVKAGETVALRGPQRSESEKPEAASPDNGKKPAAPAQPAPALPVAPRPVAKAGA